MKQNRMFMLTTTNMTMNSACFHTEIEHDSQLWDNRFGRLSYHGLVMFSSKQLVNGLPSITIPKELCANCLAGKQRRNSMPKKTLWRASIRLQLVHADICGPIKPISSSNKRYILSFIDDCTCKTWVYFLHEKLEAFSLFKNFKTLVEKEVGEKLVYLRTDRGGECTSKEFNNFCQDQGISRQLTISYTPQQNGVVKWKNRTIMNMVHSMLIGRKVPKIY